MVSSMSRKSVRCSLDALAPRRNASTQSGSVHAMLASHARPTQRLSRLPGPFLNLRTRNLHRSSVASSSAKVSVFTEITYWCLFYFKIYISESTQPHFNLSLEHYLLRSKAVDGPVLLLYRNQPCIVVGRNQNPWHELNVTQMKSLGISLVRRRSGGGAVFHVRFPVTCAEALTLFLSGSWKLQLLLQCSAGRIH